MYKTSQVGDTNFFNRIRVQLVFELEEDHDIVYGAVCEGKLGSYLHHTGSGLFVILLMSLQIRTKSPKVKRVILVGNYLGDKSSLVSSHRDTNSP